MSGVTHTAETDAIKRALTFHQTLAFGPGDQVCACDRTWRKHEDHRDHVAEAIYLATRVIPPGESS